MNFTEHASPTCESEETNCVWLLLQGSGEMMQSIGTLRPCLDESSLERLSDLLEAQHRDDGARRMVASLSAGLQHELNSPLGALASAADTVARVLGRCHRSLDGMQAAGDPQLAELKEALASLLSLCAVFDESTQRIAEVVRGLRHLEPQLRRANDLDAMQDALRLVEHQGRVRWRAAAGPAPLGCGDR